MIEQGRGEETGGDYEDSEQRQRAERVRALMAADHSQKNDQGDTGQFGGGKDTQSVLKAQSRLDKSAEKARQLAQVKVDQFQDKALEQSP